MLISLAAPRFAVASYKESDWSHNAKTSWIHMRLEVGKTAERDYRLEIWSIPPHCEGYVLGDGDKGTYVWLAPEDKNLSDHSEELIGVSIWFFQPAGPAVKEINTSNSPFLIAASK